MKIQLSKEDTFEILSFILESEEFAYYFNHNKLCAIIEHIINHCDIFELEYLIDKLSKSKKQRKAFRIYYDYIVNEYEKRKAKSIEVWEM